MGYMVDSVSAIFLICFGIGLLTSIGAFLLGIHGHGDAAHSGGTIPFVSLNTILAFLLGFGATGFIVWQVINSWLLSGALALVFTFVLADTGGFIFAFFVYSVMAKFLLKWQSSYLRESDFDLVGVEGKVSSTIFANRVGEVSYTLNHCYAAIPAMGHDGQEIKKGETVIILEVKNGIATVIPEKEFVQHI